MAKNAKRRSDKRKRFCALIGEKKVHSKLLYAAPEWASVLDNKAIPEKLSSAQTYVALILESYNYIYNIIIVNEKVLVLHG